MPDWKLFAGRKGQLALDPSISIYDPVIRFNRPALQALGNPTHAECLYNDHDGIIGFRGSDDTIKHAYRLAPNKGGGANMTAVAFLRLISPEGLHIIGLRAQMIDEVLVAHLDKGTECIESDRFSTEDQQAGAIAVTDEPDSDFLTLAEAREATGMTIKTFRRRMKQRQVEIFRDPIDERRALIRRADLSLLTQPRSEREPLGND